MSNELQKGSGLMMFLAVVAIAVIVVIIVATNGKGEEEVDNFEGKIPGEVTTPSVPMSPEGETMMEEGSGMMEEGETMMEEGSEMMEEGETMMEEVSASGTMEAGTTPPAGEPLEAR